MAPPDPLLPQQQQDGGPPPDDEPGSRGWSVRKWITALGFVLSALTCVLAVYNSNGNRIMLSSLNFLVLLKCLNRYEKAEPGSESMNRMKLCVWLHAMALAFLFSAQVSYVVPTAVAVVICVTAVGAVAGGLYRYL